MSNPIRVTVCGSTPKCSLNNPIPIAGDAEDCSKSPSTMQPGAGAVPGGSQHPAHPHRPCPHGAASQEMHWAQNLGQNWQNLELHPAGEVKTWPGDGALLPFSPCLSFPPAKAGSSPSPALCCCLVASGGGKTTGKQTPWKSEEMQIKREKQTRPNNRAPQGPHSKENGPVSGLPSIWRSQKRRSPIPSPCPGPAGSRKFPLAPQPGIFLGRAFGFGGCGSRCFPVGQGTGPGSGPLSGPACPGPALLRRVPFRTRLGPI